MHNVNAELTLYIMVLHLLKGFFKMNTLYMYNKLQWAFKTC